MAKAGGLLLLCCCLGQWVRSDGDAGGQPAHQIQHHSRDRLQIVTIAGKVRNQLAKKQSPEHAVPSLSHQRETKGAPSQLDTA